VCPEAAGAGVAEAARRADRLTEGGDPRAGPVGDRAVDEMPGPPASPPPPMLLLLLLLTVGCARAAPLPQTGAGERSPGAAGPLRLAGRRRGRRACGVGPPLRRIGGLPRAGGRGMPAISGRFLAAGAWDGGRGRGDTVGVGEDGGARWQRWVPLPPGGLFFPDS
jgi:hypothetical protein